MTRNFLAMLALVALPVWGQSGPMVGDPIAVPVDVKPGERVMLGPVEGVELIDQGQDGVLVRGFRPGPVELQLVITDESGATRTVTREIQIASVLQPGDDLEPAPLAPPIPPSPNRKAWVAIALAALAASAVWLQLFLIPRNVSGDGPLSLSAAEEFLRTIDQVRRMAPSDQRFATLSNGTRRFLSRVDPKLGRELTSAEVMDRLAGRFPQWLITEVRDVLSEGDYAKFSPWGGRSARFESIMKEANDLAVLDKGERKA